MALTNPIGVGLGTTHPNVSLAAGSFSGTGSCPPNTFIADANGWRSIRGYACGNFTADFDIYWSNSIGATDVMFLAAVQGQQVHQLFINGALKPHNAFSNAYMTCAFWNGTATSTSPGTNECWKTALNTTPLVYNGVISPSADLNLSVTSGTSCSPDCYHGTGYNVQKLMVR